MPRALAPELYPILACPCADKAPLTMNGASASCPACGASHVIVAGVPILINPEASLFDPKEYLKGPAPRKVTFTERMARLVPQIATNRYGAQNVGLLLAELDNIAKPRILIVGGGEEGAGLKDALANPRYEFIETDVYWGERVCVMADGHDLPFLSESFDAVICQAVLEHVIDPPRCVEEMHRVLRPNGVLFIDLPFLWGVHMGSYDYTRYTFTGVRLLCRRFLELKSGVSGGPGQALALSISAFFRSWSYSKLWSGFVVLVLPWFIFWLRFLDAFLDQRPQSSDAACGLFFIGRKLPNARPDKELVAQYWKYGSFKIE